MRIIKYRRLTWSPSGGAIHAVGNVEAEVTDTVTGKVSIVRTRQLDYSDSTGRLSAERGLSLSRSDGTFTATSLVYDFQNHSGILTGAEGHTDYATFSGKSIQELANGTFVVTNGEFTTCVAARPDYHLRARKITIVPRRYVSARDITFYAGSTRLITLPSYRRDLRTSAPPPTPVPGYDRTLGPFVRLIDSPVVQDHRRVDLDVRLNLSKAPTGYVAWQQDVGNLLPRSAPPLGLLPLLNDPLRGFLEQIAPPTYGEYSTNQYPETLRRDTAFIAAGSLQPIYNRNRTDLLVSRYPSAGIRMSNMLGKGEGDLVNPAEDQVVGDTEHLGRRISNAPFLLDLYAGLEFLTEYPTGAHAGKLGARLNAASQPMVFGKRLSWRLGASAWLQRYTTGQTYSLLSPEVELDYIPTRTSLFAVGYRYVTDAGHTPFVFDRRDIRHELRFQYQVGGPWAFGLLSKMDLEETRSVDTQLALLRNFDCMQVGLAYRFRGSAIGVIFRILPPGARARRRMPIATGKK
ncbi:MAG TPA: DUF3769 domain-containing protein [Chthonomonadales bacterium]|nr:DUF3769 domain-containing protein [Chthonomonadales bacterium]